jgi:site-specific DNA-adenine methylase
MYTLYLKEEVSMESPDKKWLLMPTLVSLFPDHDHYVSVFGGEGADVLCKKASKLETFNDRDGHIYKLFSVLTDEDACKELLEQLRAREAGNIVGPQDERVASALAFLTTARDGLRAAGIRCPKNPVEFLEYVRRRFLSIQIENNLPYRVIETLDSQKTLFFVAPPDAMPSGQRRAMLDLLNHVGGNVVLISEQNPDSNNGFVHWQLRKVDGVTVWFK